MSGVLPTPAGELVARIGRFGDAQAMAAQGRVTTYADLDALRDGVTRLLAGAGVGAGDRVVVVGDHGPEGAAAVLALAEMAATSIPVVGDMPAERRAQLTALSRAQYVLTTRVGDGLEGMSAEARDDVDVRDDPELLVALRARGCAGMILFTSGSSGDPKVVVHDLDLLLEKFIPEARPVRTVSVLRFDHWGGLNTVFRVLSSGGFVACPDGRRPDEICALIEQYRLDLLPASPSFLNMLLVTGADQAHDLSSLRTVTYGAEPMPGPLLTRLVERFPDIRFQLGIRPGRARGDGLALTPG